MYIMAKLRTDMPAVQIQTRRFLEKLEVVDFDPYDSRLSRRDWLLPWHMWLATRRQII